MQISMSPLMFRTAFSKARATELMQQVSQARGLVKPSMGERAITTARLPLQVMAAHSNRGSWGPNCLRGCLGLKLGKGMGHSRLWHAWLLPVLAGQPKVGNLIHQSSRFTYLSSLQSPPLDFAIFIIIFLELSQITAVVRLVI